MVEKEASFSGWRNREMGYGWKACEILSWEREVVLVHQMVSIFSVAGKRDRRFDDGFF